MKATIEFNLPEEQAQLDAALHAQEYINTLDTLLHRLRGILKYGDPSEDTAKLAEELRQTIFEELEGVPFEGL